MCPFSKSSPAVEEVAGEFAQSAGNTSQDLQQLLRTGLVRTRRDGNRIYYALASPRVAELWAAVRDVAAGHVAGHIAGAVSPPVEVEELTRRLRDLPKDRTVVAYCRGPYCLYADDAVRALTRRGYRAARLEDGYPEWARVGLPVEA